MEQAINIQNNYFINKIMEVKQNMTKQKTEIKFTDEEVQFIEEQSAYEKYIDNLISNIRVERKLNSVNLDELECSSKVECIEFLDEDILSNDNKMKLVLMTGEELEFELV